MRIKNLKKINKKALILTGVASAFAVSIFLPTFSWFKADTASPISVDGNIHGSYFESGDGTAANPFEIARPIQLYYLSWLQEMGYFNEAVYDETEGEYVLKQQYHFYLSKDIDMADNEENYVLPPIGTIKYPFIGSFDGRGHVITDLVISNDYSEYTRDPRHPAGSNTHSDSYEILGLFGVLGTTESTAIAPSSIIESDGTIHELLDTNDDNILVSYADQTNYVQNLYFDNVTIVASTDSAHALAGVVAGYSNARVTNIGIHGATLSFANGLSSVGNIGTTNLSDYTAFGFVESNFKRTVDLVNEQVYNPKATAKQYVSTSSGTAWGGSIDMANLLKRVFTSMAVGGALKNNTCPQYPKTQTRIVQNGEVISTTDTSYSTDHYSTMGSKTGYYSGDKTASEPNDETIGSYYFIDQGSTSVNSSHKAYLGGYTDVQNCTAKTVTTITKGAQEETAYYVRSSTGSGNNFISISNAGAIATNSSQDDAVKWHLDSSNHLYAHKHATNLDAIYYLNYDGTNFSLGEFGSTTWTYVNNQLTASYSISTYLIGQSGRTDRYITRNGTTGVQNIDRAANATNWIVSPSLTVNSQVTISVVVSGTTYYIGTSGNNLNLSTTPYNWTLQSNGSYYSLYNGSRWIRYNNGWVTTSTQSNRASLSFSLQNTNSGSVNLPAVTTLEEPYTFTSKTIERSGQAGYVPLSVNGDSHSTSPFEYVRDHNYTSDNYDISDFYTASTNTGYIVGGYYDKYNGEGSGNINTSNYGDVRISQYPKNYISASYNKNDNGKFDKLYTINKSSYNNGVETSVVEFDTTGHSGNTDLGFVKFQTALGNLTTTLTRETSTYVSGIHFMTASIDSNKTIVADKVMINSELKTNYEMPEDSIDFNLKEKGYINFFAGNYHEQNNSFFALHKIERDSQTNKILDIKKISKIYKNADDIMADHIYLYSDGTWSDGLTHTPNAQTDSFVADGQTYEFAFDTQWIGVNTTLIPHTGSKPSDNNTGDYDIKRVYYFEIPVNEGEYALGSCANGCGGYLIYLDISAAAQTVERKTTHELFTIDTISGDIPYGTQYVSSIPSGVTQYDGEGKEITYAIVRSGISDIDDLDSYYGSIDSTANGNYTINRSSDTITVSGSSALDSNYIGDGMSLSGDTLSGGRTSQIIRRIIDYDYNTITHLYIKQTTVVKIITENNTTHNYATTTLEYNDIGFNSAYTTIARYSYDWVGNGPDFAYSYYLHISTISSGIDVNFKNQNNTAFYLTVEYLAPGFTLTCGINPSTISSTDVSNAIANNTALPSLQIMQTQETYTPDKWYDFTKANGGYTTGETTVTPTVIATFNYTREGSAQIDQNFLFSGTLADVTQYTIIDGVIVETPINITNGSYIYEFILSNSGSTQENPIVAIYYVASGTYVVRYANGSEYILFVDESQQQNP